MAASLKKFWNFSSYEEKEWFRFVAVALMLLFGIYLVLHLPWINKNGRYEQTKLSTAQLQQINRIYFDSVYSVDPSRKAKEDSVLNNKIDSLRRFSDSLKNIKNSVDKEKNDVLLKEVDTALIKLSAKSTQLKITKGGCDSLGKTARVFEYLKSEVELIDSCQLKKMREYLCCAGTTEATGFLSNVKIKVGSTFWLDGPTQYFEIVFWTLFGVLSNLLFNLGVVSRKDVTCYFDPTEIPGQIAKLLYAPLCTIILVFGYNLFNTGSISDIYVGKGVLLFAFLCGYNSSRMIAFLDRLKDLVLPNSGSADMTVKRQVLKNIIIEISIENPLDPPLAPNQMPYPINLTEVRIINVDTKVITNVNHIEEKHSLFVASLVTPGKYDIEASLGIKDATTGLPTTRKLMAEVKKVEMNNQDVYKELKLK
jgi:hypothetical protein